jgi:acyl-CoA thioester hydrolase
MPPLSPTHSITVTVADADIDELEHANNVAYVRWLQDVAIAHSSAVGLDFEAYKRIGGVFVVRRHEVDYLRPVVRGARLDVRTWIESAMAAKCIRMTEIYGEDGILACRAKTTWGYIDLATARPARIPQEIRDAFQLAE